MNQVEVRDDLAEALKTFQGLVRGSAPVKKILTWWDRTVEIRVQGEAPRSFFLRAQKGDMLEPTTQPPGDGADIVIAASDEVLCGIFKGEINPARAHLDGQVVAAGSQKDQLVLDSIVLLIWGY